MCEVLNKMAKKIVGNGKGPKGTKYGPKPDEAKVHNEKSKGPSRYVKSPTSSAAMLKDIPSMGKASEHIKKALDSAKALGKKAHTAAKSHIKELVKKHGASAIDKVGDTAASLLKDKAPSVTHGLIDKGAKYVKDKLKSKI